MNHLKSLHRSKNRSGRGCFSSLASSRPSNPHDCCIQFPFAKTLGQVCLGSSYPYILLDSPGEGV